MVGAIDRSSPIVRRSHETDSNRYQLTRLGTKNNRHISTWTTIESAEELVFIALTNHLTICSVMDVPTHT